MELVPDGLGPPPSLPPPPGPALFLGALWLPYRRDRSRLEAALAAATAGGPAAAAAAAAEHGGGHAALQAVFAHTDIVRKGEGRDHLRVLCARVLHFWCSS